MSQIVIGCTDNEGRNRGYVEIDHRPDGLIMVEAIDTTEPSGVIHRSVVVMTPTEAERLTVALFPAIEGLRDALQTSIDAFSSATCPPAPTEEADRG